MSNKELIKQYTNTGAILPEYQVNKLSSNNIKTYLRRRLQQANETKFYVLKRYEFLKLSDKEKGKYLNTFSDLSYAIEVLLDNSIYTSRENRLEIIKQIITLVNYKLDDNMVGELLRYTPEENRLEIFKLIITLLKDNLNYKMVGELLRFTPKEKRLEIFKQIIPLLKDNLNYKMVGELLYFTSRENRLEIIKQIIPLLKDKLDGKMIGELLDFASKENMSTIQDLISKYKK
jgi:F0F1-type ATP synthase delta subunit